MKNIEIITSQNVVIEYQLASVMDRFLAFLLDSVILVVYYLFLLFMSFVFVKSYNSTVFIMTFFMPVVLFYHLFAEAFFGGQSLGKRALGIKVVGLSGQVPTMSQCMLRWIFRTVDLGGTLGLFASIYASASDKSQRLGDTVARTVVIKLNPANRFSIQEIMQIKDASTHGEILYPGVTRFTDEDMLLIKNAIERVRLYPNEKHKDLVRMLTVKVCEMLNLEVPEKDKIAFLRQVLQEYIILTR